MPDKRKEILANGEIYHAFNRSIGNVEILIGKKELERALSLLDYYRFLQKIRYSQYKSLAPEVQELYNSEFRKTHPIVEIHAFAFMPDHYHLLLKQTQDNGIATYLSNVQNSFAKYFNRKHSRSGGLFQRPFKAKRITSDEIFLHVSRYIHLNPVTSYLIEYDQLKTYPWTSYTYYKGKKNDNLVNIEFTISIIGSTKKYESFVSNQVDYQRKLHLVKRFAFD